MKTEVKLNLKLVFEPSAQVSSINLSKPNGISHHYNLDGLIFNFLVLICGVFLSTFFKCLKQNLSENSENPDQIQHHVASDLGVQCLSLSH